MTSGRAWFARLIGYLVRALVWTAAMVALGWPFFAESGRRTLVLVALVAMVTQALAFGLLAGQRPGSPRFFGSWAAGTLLRLGVLGGVGFALEGSKEFEPVVALLAMAGLFVVLMLLELRTLRCERINRDFRTSQD
ncbi:MAG: hypothetical protein WD013_00130 [Gemmatimonadota bacterium]